MNSVTQLGDPLETSGGLYRGKKEKNQRDNGSWGKCGRKCMKGG